MIKMSFQHIRKTGIFPKDYGQIFKKNLLSLLFCQKKYLALSFDDVVFSKEGVLDDKNVILL